MATKEMTTKTQGTRTRSRVVLLKTLQRNLIDDATRRRNVPAQIAQEAFTITVRSLGLSSRVAWTDKARAEHYFWAVIRRKATKRNSDQYLMSKYLISSVVADLRTSGFSDGRILAELERDWAAKVPSKVMDEFRAKLAPMQVAM